MLGCKYDSDFKNLTMETLAMRILIGAIINKVPGILDDPRAKIAFDVLSADTPQRRDQAKAAFSELMKKMTEDAHAALAKPASDA